MQQYQTIGGIFGAAIVIVMAAQPVLAVTEVIGVQIVPSGSGVQVILQTKDGATPSYVTANRGNDIIADFITTRLRLPGDNSFRQNNPAPGIASVVVTPLDANSIRVVVTGTSSAPQGQNIEGSPQGIILSYTTAGGTAATPPTMSTDPATQTPTPQTPNVMVPNPQITQGQPAPAPGASQGPAFFPRAVPPPVGDIAAANTDPAANFIALDSSERIGRLVLRDAPVRDVLSLLARTAGKNFVYIDAPSGMAGQPQPAQGAQDAGGGPRISLDIENEPIQDVFNYVLRASGLEANRAGDTIFGGVKLPNSARDIVVRTYRINQIPATRASGFLVSLGAESAITTTRQVTEASTVAIPGSTAGIVNTQTSTRTTIEALTYESKYSQPILRGLQVSVDEPTNTLTLVGPRRLVEIATSQLVTLDVRRRQVAVNVKIIDVNLVNTDNLNSSFSFGIGDSFFINDGGVGVANFGGTRPPAANPQALSYPPIVDNPYADEEVQFDRNSTIQIPLTAPGGGAFFLRPIPPISGSLVNPRVSEYEVFTLDDNNKVTDFGSAEFSLPTLFRYPRKFLALLQASVVSGNAKILTDPTLTVQEGENASVNLTQEVYGGFRETGENNIEPIIKPAGIILGVTVERIDDNGFVTMNITPRVSVPIPSTFNSETFGDIVLLQERTLNSGRIRLRDGQTLILSGIIQENDRTTVTKLPILGDLPLIGALFRNTSTSTTRQEVIVLVTPQIMDDSDNAGFGYYAPGRDAQQMINRP